MVYAPVEATSIICATTSGVVVASSGQESVRLLVREIDRYDTSDGYMTDPPNTSV